MNMNSTLHRLAEKLESRKIANGGDPATSYVAKLYAKGTDSILKKIGEEAAETIIAGDWLRSVLEPRGKQAASRAGPADNARLQDPETDMFTQRIKNVMERKKILMSPPDTTVSEAARLMAERKVDPAGDNFAPRASALPGSGCQS